MHAPGRGKKKTRHMMFEKTQLMKHPELEIGDSDDLYIPVLDASANSLPYKIGLFKSEDSDYDCTVVFRRVEAGTATRLVPCGAIEVHKRTDSTKILWLSVMKISYKARPPQRQTA